MEEGDTVKPEYSDDERSLRTQVDESERVLSDLEKDLRDVDRELEQLSEENHKYEVLGDVCRSLEELEVAGGDTLFWKEGEDPAEYLREARDRIHAFGESIIQVEGRRREIVARIGDQNLQLDCLHYDLADTMEREESRRNEWIVERDADEVPVRPVVMPWGRGYEEDKRYRKSLTSSFVTSFVLAILVGSVAIPIKDRPKELELPERMAKLVREQLPPPPEPERIVEPDIDEEIPEPEPEPELAEEVERETAEVEQAPQLAAADEPDIKEQVKSKGILAFRESFASASSLRPDAQLGLDASVSNAGSDEVGRPTRAMVTTNAPGSSGGINLASISRNVGGGGPGMGGVAVSRVASSIGSGGDGFSNRPMAGSVLAGRTDEEIQIVFDRYKAALYRLYNRELRKDPTLRGQIIIKLTIEPDGSVSFCTLQSSDMGAPMLAEQVIERVATFDFGAKEDIAAVTIIYPIDFLPAA
jgi:outer membrane biosynthesis protein TonB